MANTATYSELLNAKFQNTSSHFVDLTTRYNNTVNQLPKRARINFDARLKKAIKAFKKANPNVISFDRSVFPLCLATDVPLSKIVIDTTMQREPNLNWLLTILENFRAYQVQPIQIFDTGDGRYGAWDSQHTALDLFIIATQILGLDIDKVMVPSVLYAVTSRANLRNLFISMNSTKGNNAGKKELDIIDIMEQMIYGVEVDGVNDPIWEDAHKKWEYIKDAGMFLTAEKFHNTEEIGAISRLNEIQDVVPEVVRMFSVYGRYIVDLQQRAINTKEIPIIMEFFDMCYKEQIKISDEDIEELAQHCVDLFDANFDSKGEFWKMVHQANINAWNAINKGKDKEYWGEPPRNLKNTAQGINFFYYQLKKSWVPTKNKEFKFPKAPTNVYIPNQKDLY